MKQNNISNDPFIRIFIVCVMLILSIFVIAIITTPLTFKEVWKHFTDPQLVIKEPKFENRYQINNVTCKTGVRGWCGFNLFECNDNNNYRCATNVKVIKEQVK